MSNSLLTSVEKTNFQGIYKKTTKKGIAFIARFTVEKKTKTQIVGYEKDGVCEYEAFKRRLELISSSQLLNALQKTNNESFLIPNLFLQFIKYRESFLKKNTNSNYKSIYNQYIKKDFENKDIREITKEDLQRYINKLLEYRRPGTVEKIVSAFKKFYHHLQGKNIYNYNAALELKMPKFDNKKYFSITKRDLNKIVEYIKNIESHFYKTLYMILFHGRRVKVPVYNHTIS